MTDHTKNVLLHVLENSLETAVMAFQELFDQPQDDTGILDDLMELNSHIKAAYCQFHNLSATIKKKNPKRKARKGQKND